ncbi:hypothetical protein EVAR_99920_1 [Eumeta japonica]|uniref:Uncharacterized protein n=1 Tax=Eumeta variegata TaxID=151549 RepID=A0A4C1Z2J4_EUMVA|nr:hypothetical protein EVAR_99920_1 [Eumeta japonica]
MNGRGACAGSPPPADINPPPDPCAPQLYRAHTHRPEQTAGAPPRRPNSIRRTFSRVVTARSQLRRRRAEVTVGESSAPARSLFHHIVEAQRPLFIARKDQALSYSRWPSAGLQPLATVLLTMVTDVLSEAQRE